jgi:ribosomal protein L7Ae-like RNA K-turn-binding protein
MMDKVYSLLGLAKKAGQLLSGDETCERTIKSGKAVLVIVASDASENTKDKFKSMCNFRNVCYREYGEKLELGRYTGKEIRAVISVSSNDFKNGLLKLIDNQINESGGEGIGKS